MLQKNATGCAQIRTRGYTEDDDADSQDSVDTIA